MILLRHLMAMTGSEITITFTEITTTHSALLKLKQSGIDMRISDAVAAVDGIVRHTSMLSRHDCKFWVH